MNFLTCPLKRRKALLEPLEPRVLLSSDTLAAGAGVAAADVAASDDLTGSAVLGGDWDLEVSAGVIEDSLIFGGLAAKAYPYTLSGTFQGSKNDAVVSAGSFTGALDFTDGRYDQIKITLQAPAKKK